MKVVKYNAWAERLMDMIIGERELIQTYHDLIRNKSNPDRDEEFQERIDGITPILTHNVGVYLTAEVEKDYMIFYIDKGVPGYIMTNKTAVREVYERQAELDRMVA